MADSLAKFLKFELFLSLFIGFFSLVCAFLASHLIFIHLANDVPLYNSMLLYFLIRIFLSFSHVPCSMFSLCFIVFSFDLVYFSSFGLFSFFVLLYFYCVQPFLNYNLQKQYFEVFFMMIYVCLSDFLVLLILNLWAWIAHYFLVVSSV